jgi:hypothetical protein
LQQLLALAAKQWQIDEAWLWYPLQQLGELQILGNVSARMAHDDLIFHVSTIACATYPFTDMGLQRGDVWCCCAVG